MSKKHRGGPTPVPPGNRPQMGPVSADTDEHQPSNADESTGASIQDQDPQRRLGGYGGAGEHPRQQPGRLNDGDTHSQ
jgi:hypothetical protein